MVRWLLGLGAVGLLIALVAAIAFWPYVLLAGMWLGIWRKYRRLGRRQV